MVMGGEIIPESVCVCVCSGARERVELGQLCCSGQGQLFGGRPRTQASALPSVVTQVLDIYTDLDSGRVDRDMTAVQADNIMTTGGSTGH